MGSQDGIMLSAALKERVKKVFSIYSQKSSISSIAFIVGSKYPAVRVLWTVLFIVALLALTLHLVLLFMQYLSYRKQSITELGFSTLPFPAITFCNVNPLRMSKIHLASPKLQQLIRAFDATRLRELKKEFVRPDVLPGEQQSNLRYKHASYRNHSRGTTYPIPTGYSNNGTDEVPAPQNYIHKPDYGPTPDPKDMDNDFLMEESNILANSFDVDGFLGTSWDDEHIPMVAHMESNTKVGAPGLVAPISRHSSRERVKPDSSVSTFSKINAAFRILYSAESTSVRREMSHHLSDMLIHCDFATKTCKTKDFKLVPSNLYGNCYTLEYDTFLVANDGPMSGLDIILYLQVDDHIKGFTSSKGAQVVVHEPGTIPFPEDEGFSVAAGMHTMVGLKMRRISRLGAPYGTCADVDTFKNEHGTIYTRQTCQKLCQMREIKETCNCLDTTGVFLTGLLNFTNDVKPCRSFSERGCAIDTLRNMSKESRKKCFCNNPCDEQKYVKTISSRLWPDDDYAKVIVNHVCSKRGEGQCANLNKKNGARLSQEFLKLTIYYEDLNYEELREVPNYELVQLVSDIGGTLGLWIGLSLLSVCEIAHILISLFVTVFCPVVKQHYTKHKDERIISSESKI